MTKELIPGMLVLTAYDVLGVGIIISVTYPTPACVHMQWSTKTRMYVHSYEYIFENVHSGHWKIIG